MRIARLNSQGKQIYYDRMKIYNRFFPKSKATSCNTYSHNHVQF